MAVAPLGSFSGPPSGPTVTVVTPFRNAQAFLEQTAQSVACQDFQGCIEWSLFDDASTDDSLALLCEALVKFFPFGPRRKVVISGHSFGPIAIECPDSLADSLLLQPSLPDELPLGVGAAKNRCVAQSNGEYLCFLDADDRMFEHRVRVLCERATVDTENGQEFTLYGSAFVREPLDSTQRYVHWLHTMTPSELFTQRFRECTVIQPTWFMSRDTFNRVGRYAEQRGFPEDLDFFLRFCELGGNICRVDEVLVVYRYGGISANHGIPRNSLIALRAAAFQRVVLPQWEKFTIWGCGKDGKDFFQLLTPENKKKVTAFCEVAARRLESKYYIHCETKERVPLISWEDAHPPVVLCVKPFLEDFMANLRSKRWREGVDYYHFS